MCCIPHRSSSERHMTHSLAYPFVLYVLESAGRVED